MRRWCPTFRIEGSMKYLGSCVDHTGEEITGLRESAHQVRQKDFAEAIGSRALDRWAKAHHYDKDFPLEKDLYGKYYQGCLGGDWKRPVWFLTWSAYEHIWQSID